MGNCLHVDDRDLGVLGHPDAVPLALKEANPAKDVTVFFRDMRTYGFKEDYYREAADKDVKFIQYEPENPPKDRTGSPQEHPV